MTELMKFDFHRIDTLPKLSWCAVLEKGNNTIDVFHGPWIETRGSFFVEGAWDGPFKEGGFDISSVFMGSGGKLVGNKVIFCTPCHPMDRLHILQIGSRLFISSSLVFLLKHSGTSLDLNYIPYQSDLLKMVLEMDNHVGTIPTEDGNKIIIVHYRNIEINTDLELSITLKTDPPKLESFLSYKNFLIKNLLNIYQNANSEDRFIKYKVTSTISSGYDSAAFCALLSEIGICDEAVSFRESRGEFNDSGAIIGTKLGFQVREYNREDVYIRDGFPEAEFVAVGDLGQDFAMSVFEDAFRQQLVITGDQGDVLHDRIGRYNKTRYDIIMPEAGGCDLTEFRHRTGFIRVMPAFFAAKNQPDIFAISNSAEMKPWCLYHDYDRPIPRRILMEKGINSDMFGRNKKAVSILINTNNKLQEDMKQASFQSFYKFYKQNKRKRSWIKQTYWDVMFAFYRLHCRLFLRLNQYFQKRNISISIPCPIPYRFRQSPAMPSFLVHWGISIIEKRYETAKKVDPSL